MKYYYLCGLLATLLVIPSHSSLAQEQQNNGADKAPPKAATKNKAPDAADDKKIAQAPVIRAKLPRVDEVRMRLLAQKTELGSQIWLQQNQQQFLSIYHPNNQHPGKGALLILHDDGQHPRWPDTIETISATMPDYGWATLSISLPDIKPSKTKKPANQSDTSLSQTEQQAVARIQAALDYLGTQGLLNVILVGSGSGAPRGANLLQSLPSPGPTPEGTKAARAIAALVIINDNNPSELTSLSPNFNDASMPILDIYFGSQETTLAAAKRRKQMASRSKMKTYQQIRLAELNGLLSLGENRLSKRVRGFIERNAKGVAKTLERL